MRRKWRVFPPFLFLLVCGGLVAAAYLSARIGAGTESRIELPIIGKADLNLVDKSDRRLTLMKNGGQIAVYKIALGGEPVGHKQFEGDQKTPEGDYVIDWKNPKSRYHLSLHISYPSPQDTAFAASAGRSAGGDIMIHGLAPAMTAASPLYDFGDWTAGCISVTNMEIRQIWNAVDNGTRITIQP